MIKRLEELAATARRALATPQSPIRPMRPEDLSEVLRMIRLHDDDDYRAAQRSFAHHDPGQRPEHGAHFVYFDPQEQRPLGVIGYSVDDLEARGTYWLGWTYVNPFSRGKGIGAQLMRFNIAALRALGRWTGKMKRMAADFQRRADFGLEVRLEWRRQCYRTTESISATSTTTRSRGEVMSK